MSYREILYGIVFGIGACLIDVVMHVEMAGRSFAEELFRPSLEMLFYRALFLLLGILVGVVLWQKNRREREARRFSDLLDKLRHDLAAPLVMIHSNAELLLMREDKSASHDVDGLVRSIYEQTKRLQAIVEQ